MSESLKSDTIKGGKYSGANTINTVNLTFLAEKAGNYTGQIIVFSPENVHDVRVLEIKIQAIVPKGQNSILNFKSPARKEIVQVQ
jgi:hypothetical protein